MNNLSWQIGNVKITQIIELNECESLQEAIPNATPENLLKIPWLTPNFIDNRGNFKSLISGFVIESMGTFILVDTGVGNNKQRSDFPFWSNLKTDFLERLKQSFPKINFLISTHLHPSELKEDCEGIKDSVLPVHDAGLVDLIPSDFSITDEVSIIPTPGHTPGHVSIFITSKGEQAVITGDTMHHPCQVAHPEWETIDTNGEQANKSRRALLEQFVDTNTLFIGSHFAPPTAGYLYRDGSGFKFETSK